MSEYECIHTQAPRRAGLDREIARLAAGRHGAFSRSEARALGATPSMVNRRVASGRWEPLYRGVYRLGGAPATWKQSLVAACLAWDGVASHRSAGALWQLPGFEPGPIELIAPRSRRRHDHGVVAHWVEVPPAHVTTLERIPVTRPFRTLVDLASFAAADMIEEALDDALRRGLVSVRQMRWLLDRNGSPRGNAAMRRLLEERASGGRDVVPESVLETKLWRALRSAGIRGGVAQHQVRDAGRVVAVVDVAFPEQKVAVEADGYRWHAGRARWARDLDRRNALIALGWRVLHVTWRDLTERPEHVAATVARVLEEPARQLRRNAPRPG